MSIASGETDPKGPGENAYAAIALNVPIRREFDYAVPRPLRGRMRVGCRALVPFGARRMVGYCVRLLGRPRHQPVKDVIDVIDTQPLIGPDLMELARRIADHYFCSWGEALNAVLPAGVRHRRRRRRAQVAVLTADAPEALSTIEIIRDKAPAQAKILRALLGYQHPPTVAELKKVTGTTVSSLRALERKGLVEVEMRLLESELPTAEVPETPLESVLAPTGEQAKALETIAGVLDEGAFRVMLLHGVTGSGKTEVYLQAIARAVESGRQAIVLVPEISLTPQTIRRFRARFNRVAVLHSRLTDAERLRYWNSIRQGEAEVVIGARSAVFAPVPNLGLVVIDEEHENTFKQDSTPRYHARDVAIIRAFNARALVILGSATPSLESYMLARSRRYAHAVLSRRIASRPLPPVEIVDMARDYAHNRRPHCISRRLHELVTESLDAGRQVILFLNRRGYAGYVNCPRCGYVAQCDRCDISLTYHRRFDLLLCHYCGKESRSPERCPECASEGIRLYSVGTEKIEEEVRAGYPGVACARMDSDTMRGRDAHEKVLHAFREGEVRILIGTQMIAKGLDFPNVTTVGVVNADVALHMPDFRSRERTFQLLAQVAGRTGRGEAGGRVVVQTFRPDEFSIQLAADHDYAAFAERELEERRKLRYPPYSRLVRIVARSRERESALDRARLIAVAMQDVASRVAPGIEVLGPSMAPIERIRASFRYHVLAKLPNPTAIREVLGGVDAGLLHSSRQVHVTVDVDPVDML